MTIDRLSGGRLILPVGLGTTDDSGFGNVGEPTDARTRAELMDESLAILEGLWSGEPFAFEGRHYRFGPMTFRPTPIQRPRIPIWVVGAWPNERSMQRILRWDGIVTQTGPRRDPGDRRSHQAGEADEPSGPALRDHRPGLDRRRGSERTLPKPQTVRPGRRDLVDRRRTGRPPRSNRSVGASMLGRHASERDSCTRCRHGSRSTTSGLALARAQGDEKLVQLLERLARPS